MFRAPGGSSVSREATGTPSARATHCRVWTGGMYRENLRTATNHDAAALRAMPTHKTGSVAGPPGIKFWKRPGTGLIRRAWHIGISLPSASGLERIQPRPLMPVEPNTSFGGDFYRQECKRVPRR